jgi:cell division protein FtsQ
LSTTTFDRKPIGPAPIDPRIRARLIAVRRDEGRRRLRRVVAVGVLALVVVAAALVVRSPVLDVDRVQVSGADRTGTDAVRQAAGIALHRPMIDVDTGAARARLLALPWVERASVTRSWPSSIKVSVVERVPIAVVPAGQAGFAIVDKGGRVVMVAPTAPEGVIVLLGLAPPGVAGSSLAPEAAGLLTVAAALPAKMVGRIAAVAVAPDGVELRLAPAGVVRLGPPIDVAAKLLAALTMLDQVDLAHACTIDVRVPSAPSLTRATPCA